MSMKTSKLNKRQDAILSLIEKKGSVSIGQIIEHIGKELGEVTRITISRDLKKILNLGLIQRKGKGRSAYYELSAQYSIIKKIDVEKYFSIDSDQREIKKHNFLLHEKSLAELSAVLTSYIN